LNRIAVAIVIVLFLGGCGGASSEVTAEPTYHFEADGDNAALTEDSDEINMITNVTAKYAPVS
jgi:hypothetical protein